MSKNRFLRNIAIAATGTAGAQAITMAFSPIITRLYGPEIFGIVGSFLAVIAVLTPMVALTYPIAIILPEDDDDARGLAKLSMLITIISSALAGLIINHFNERILSLFGINELNGYLMLLPLAMLFAGFHQIVEQWVIRKKSYRMGAKVAIVQSLIINSSKAGFGLIYSTATPLIILSTFSSLLYGAMLAFGINLENKISKAPTNRKKIGLLALAKKFKDFPIFRAPEVTLNAASQGLAVLMLAAFFGPASAGFYTLGRTVLAMPAALLGKSIGDVFYPRLAEATHKNEDITKLVMQATKGLALVGIVPFGLVIAFGPWLFSLVFGSEWQTSGDYARWLSVWLFFGFINTPSIKALPVINAQFFLLFSSTLMLVARAAALALGYYYFNSDIIAVIAFSISGALLNLLLILITIKLCKNRYQSNVSARPKPSNLTD
ncbi:lipopolysaccharide biosynthesis protein [Pseudomonas helleri]|uniref:lipopolysaccharide biosynthesis protein n=1 Tax=Pseudomonas helleri TaxID=1608996 RepID=UPI0028E32A06|nr:lipopolysaccharide biosynthesis protein [Pseudomonas helleri]